MFEQENSSSGWTPEMKDNCNRDQVAEVTAPFFYYYYCHSLAMVP